MESIVCATLSTTFFSLLLNASLHFSMQYTLSVFPLLPLKQSVMHSSLSSIIPCNSLPALMLFCTRKKPVRHLSSQTKSYPLR